MNELRDQAEPTILVGRHARMMSIVLNRPRVLNSLNLEMIRFIDRLLDEIEADQNMQFVLLSGAGERGFCAGGDIKALAQAVQQGVSPTGGPNPQGGVRPWSETPSFPQTGNRSSRRHYHGGGAGSG